VHPADIQPEPEIVVKPEQITETLPLNLGISGVEIGKAHRGWKSVFTPNISTISKPAHELGCLG